jgi:hypothetical protein
MGSFLLTLVAGIVVVVVGLILEYRTKWFARALESARGKQDGVDEYMAHPTPSEIAVELDRLPVLQQESAAKRFVGRKVDWFVLLREVGNTEKEKGRRVSARDYSQYAAAVMFDVDLDKYPEFSILGPQHNLRKRLHVKGEISEIKREPNNMWGFTLSNCAARVE